MSLFADAMALKTALTAKPFDGRAALDAFVKVLYDVMGPATMGAAGGEGETAKAMACLEECVACCRACSADPETVGKIGDGKILALILKVLPLVLAFV